MDHVNRFRAALFNSASKEFKAFEHTFRDELAIQEREQSTEIGRLKDENKVLRLQLSQINELEHKLQQVRSNDNSADIRCTAGTSTALYKAQESSVKPGSLTSEFSKFRSHVALECHSSSHRQFLECSLELERVKRALDICQNEAKRWKSRYRRTLCGTLQTSLGSSEQYAVQYPRPRSAPVAASTSNASLANIEYPHYKDAPSKRESASLPQTKSVQDLHQLRGTQEHTCSEHDSASIDQEGHPPDVYGLATSSCQTDGGGKADLDSDEVYHPLPGRALHNGVQPGLVSSKEDQTEIAVEPDSDVPIVMSEVSLKRKRRTIPVDSSRERKKLKEESSSSSPFCLHTVAMAQNIQESIDLDEVSNHLVTPRKDQRKQQRMYSIQKASPTQARDLKMRCRGSLLFHDDNKLPKDINDEVSGEVQITSPARNIGIIRDEAWCRKEGERYTTRLIEKLKLRHEQEVERQGRHMREKQTDLVRRVANPPQKRPESVHHGSAYRSVLQPTDANKALPRTSESHSSCRRTPSPLGWHHGAKYINYLSEDGENGANTENYVQHRQAAHVNNTLDGRESPRPSEVSASHRLGHLLAGPSPDTPRLCPDRIQPSTSRSTGTTQTPSFNVKHGQRLKISKPPSTGPASSSLSMNPEPFHTSTKTATVSHPIEPHTTPFFKGPAVSNPSIQSKKRSLRFAPVSHLSLDDFKVNPAQNQGFSHAFKGTIRGRAQRKCLPGCTRLECCGTTFRKMAEMNLFRPNPKCNLFCSMSSQEDEDTKMMKDFLGDQAYKLEGMSKEEKAEVLLKAKTKIMADQFGKHREVYAREPSPVGFWDVDMPNSQEAAEQKQMAEIRTRQKVQERYDEAMKKDGQWKFKDE